LLQRSGRRAVPDEVFAYFPLLRDRLTQPGGTFSGGEQQMLAIARALVGEPDLMLLDEPSEGLQPTIVELMAGIIQRVRRDRAVSILLVEQNLRFAREVADVYYIMESGSIVLHGRASDLANEEAIAQYLAV
jgi:ABC-type branched-subunit amino acid transport system ATPase component